MRQTQLWIALVLALGSVHSACARVEKSTVPCDEKMCLWERPVVAASSTWRLDTERSARVRTAIYLLANDPSAQTDSSTHIVTQAFARMANVRLEDFIIAERDRLLGPALDMQVTEMPAVKDGGGARLPAIEIAPRPGRSGAVQTVVFAQDGDYFVTLTYSAASRDAHRAHFGDFARFVASYRANSTATATTPDNQRAKR